MNTKDQTADYDDFYLFLQKQQPFPSAKKDLPRTDSLPQKKTYLGRRRRRRRRLAGRCGRGELAQRVSRHSRSRSRNTRCA